MIKKKHYQKVVNMALSLIKNNGAITTLEIKNALRKKHGTITWLQDDVSNVMQDLYSKNNLEYNDTGIFIIYSKKENSKKKSTKTTNKMKPTVKRVARTTVINTLIGNPGRFMTVSWTKKNGEPRTINGMVKKKSAVSPTGYIRFQTNGGYKQVDTRTISELKANGITYRVRK